MSQPSLDRASAPVVAANRGVKRGLPASGLQVAEDSARKLWDVARRSMAAKEAFAKQHGWKSPSGGSWAARIAMLRGFKLIVMKGDQIGLSDLGQQLVNDSNPEEQLTARREAVMNLKAYRELVLKYDGTTLPSVATLASSLKFEYGKTEEFSMNAAQAFIDTLGHAEMIDAENIVRKDATLDRGGGYSLPLPEKDELEDEREAAEIDQAFEDEQGERQAAEGLGSSDYSLRGQPDASQVSLAVTLDLSKYRAEEVIQIIRALGLNGNG